MLLAIGQDNAQFISLPLKQVLLPIQGAKIEHCGSCSVALERLGHTPQNPRGQLPSPWVAQYPGTGATMRHEWARGRPVFGDGESSVIGASVFTRGSDPGRPPGTAPQCA